MRASCGSVQAPSAFDVGIHLMMAFDAQKNKVRHCVLSQKQAVLKCLQESFNIELRLNYEVIEEVHYALV